MSTNKNFQHISAIDSDVSQEILRAVNELKQGSGFGSIEIVLHEGRVTLIEKREKVRFNHDTKPALNPKTSGGARWNYLAAYA